MYLVYFWLVQNVRFLRYLHVLLWLFLQFVLILYFDLL